MPSNVLEIKIRATYKMSHKRNQGEEEDNVWTRIRTRMQWKLFGYEINIFSFSTVRDSSLAAYLYVALAFVANTTYGGLIDLHMEVPE